MTTEDLLQWCPGQQRAVFISVQDSFIAFLDIGKFASYMDAQDSRKFASYMAVQDSREFASYMAVQDGREFSSYMAVRESGKQRVCSTHSCPGQQ